MSTQRKRPQAVKTVTSRRTKQQHDHVLDLRNGSRTSPVPSGTDYRRKPKHARMGWDD